MKKRILERYRRNSSGKLAIDIASEKVSDLYDDFDKRANSLPRYTILTHQK